MKPKTLEDALFETINESLWEKFSEEGITPSDIDLVDLDIEFSPVIPIRGDEPCEVIETVGGYFLIPDRPFFGVISRDMIKIMRYRYLINRRNFPSY